ncbi:MAG: hypothetical protein R3314_11790 [Longimicrobiales bacterium]|nr:hypothetical protein [Longimicrobiales bacterium]
MRAVVVLTFLFPLVGCDDAGPEPLQTTAEPPRAWSWTGPDIPPPSSQTDPVWAARYREASLKLAQLLAVEDPSVELERLDPRVEGTDAATAVRNAMISVHARTDLPARDTVVEHCGIHVAVGPPAHELQINIDHAGAWAAAWKDGQIRTGQPAVDTLTEKYGLRWHRYLDGQHVGDWVMLRGSQPLNMTGLARLFTGIEGLDEVVPGDTAEIRGQGIHTFLESGVLILEYSVGWGDCPSGCTNHRTWRFGVEGTGDVTFLGAIGQPLPDPGDGYGTICQSP